LKDGIEQNILYINHNLELHFAGRKIFESTRLIKGKTSSVMREVWNKGVVIRLSFNGQDKSSDSKKLYILIPIQT